MLFNCYEKLGSIRQLLIFEQQDAMYAYTTDAD